jgi:hypothetical protein
MFQFVTFHNDDSFLTLSEMVETIQEFGLAVVEKTFSLEWDETTLVLQGTRAQFEKFFLSEGEGDPSQSVNIDEFMDELEEVA